MADEWKGCDLVIKKSMRHEGSKNPVFRCIQPPTSTVTIFLGLSFLFWRIGRRIVSVTLKNDLTNNMMNYMVAQMVKNLPAVQETQLQTLGQEDPLENGRATHSSILAWRIPWTEEPGGLQSMGGKESDMTEQITLSLFQLTK